ncbi:MAG TPA: hypothetical protein VJM79_08200 [Rhizorhapis sp.]|nr:hypothetical protein [Rhizorhapis sp.]
MSDNLFSVIPAKAGTHLLTVRPGASYGRWIPAFAGMTLVDRHG